MSSSIDPEVQEVFRKIFNKPELMVSRTMTTNDIPGWSSLLHIKLMVALEKRFKIELSADEVVGLKNVGDLLDLVKNKSKS